MPPDPAPPPAPALPRILIAERSPTVGLAIAAWLRGWGHQAQVVRTEAAARAALAAAPCDLLIADAAFALADATVPRLALLPSGTAAEPGALVRPVQPDALRAAVASILAPAANGLDLAAIAELWGAVDSPAFRRIAAVFLAEAPTRLAAIVAAQAAGDRARLAHESHALAGAALNVGLPELVRLARILEHAAPTTPPAALAPDLLALQHAARDGLHALEQAIAAP